MTLPEWMAPVETVTFAVMIGTVIYNRLMTYRRMDARTIALETSFRQYQADMQHYLKICELCRGEVRHHHEDEIERHVTPSMRSQIETLVDDVREIKRYLMEHSK